ncbi:leucine-rich repeat-domain-containing protein [Pavlovales sp. CCMP2436]|nr:leucine-rich repeat-domain-containing protein [Pavlovales sp. CCMP2436]
MRLTVDLIARRPQFINPLKERELDLRGQRIPAIENLSATQDQFDAIDLSNNDLKKLESISVLKRLKMLLLSNNKLSRIAENLGTNFPKLEQLVMSNNDFAQLADLDNLCTLSTLKSLSLVDNSVTKLPDYRAYVLHLLPKLRVLDFTKVKQKVHCLALPFFIIFLVTSPDLQPEGVRA